MANASDIDNAFEVYCQLTGLDVTAKRARFDFISYLGWSLLRPSTYLSDGVREPISSAERKVQHLNGPNASVIFAASQARRCKWTPKWCGALTARIICAIIISIITIHEHWGIWKRKC